MIYIVVYSLENGRQEFTWNQWLHQIEEITIHRVDGPAILYKGTEEWHIEDECYSKAKFNKIIQEVKDMPQVLRLIDPRKWVREWK